MPVGTHAGDVFLEGHYRNAPTFGREMSRSVQTPATRAGEEASKHFGRKFAAAHGRLGVVVRAAMLNGRHRPRPGAISGVVALARIQAKRGEWLDEELRRVGLL
jgi:hypothetical protein